MIDRSADWLFSEGARKQKHQLVLLGCEDAQLKKARWI